jgi:hypothetical protein
MDVANCKLYPIINQSSMDNLPDCIQFDFKILNVYKKIHAAENKYTVRYIKKTTDADLGENNSNNFFVNYGLNCNFTMMEIHGA